MGQEDIKTHEHSGATTRGGEYSEGARRVHWENTRAAYDKYYCDGCDQHQTYYRGDEDYGNYNSDGYYTYVELEHHGTTAADATSMKQTMETIFTITARMVTETTTAKASTPAPALKTIMMAAADTRAMTKNIDVGTNARLSMADTTTITTARRPADMKRPTPPQMMTPVLPPVKVAGTSRRRWNVWHSRAHTNYGYNIKMAGIIERPAKLKSKYNRLAENRFAALSEEEEEKHGGYSTVTDLCATNKARG